MNFNFKKQYKNKINGQNRKAINKKQINDFFLIILFVLLGKLTQI